MLTVTDPLLIVVVFMTLLAFLLVSAFVEKVLEVQVEVSEERAHVSAQEQGQEPEEFSYPVVCPPDN